MTPTSTSSINHPRILDNHPRILENKRLREEDSELSEPKRRKTEGITFY